MAIDRSKFKSTPTAQMIQKDKEVENKLKNNGITDYHTIDEGKNLFRFYPAHPESEGDQFAEIKCVAYLPVEYQEKDKQGNLLMEGGKPKMKEGRKSIFNARIHGNAPKDLVEEYISFMDKLSKENFTLDSEKKEFMEYIKGRYDKDASKRLPSSDYTTSWTIYADKYPNGNPNTTPTFGRLEIKKTVKERLNKIASQMEGSDDPMQTDPFTDIEEGRAVVITYNKNATKAEDFYTTDLDQSQVTETIGTRVVKMAKTFPLTDQQLEDFSKCTPLYTQFRNAFKRKDFDAQMIGLQLLDKKIQSKFGIGAFSYDKWLDICDELSELWPEEDETDSSQTESQEDDGYNGTTETSSNVVKPTSTPVEGGEIDFDEMSRQELKNFIQINRTGIIIKGTDTDDDLRNKCRQWQKLSNSPQDSDAQGDEMDAEAQAKQRIQALKAKAGQQS